MKRRTVWLGSFLAGFGAIAIACGSSSDGAGDGDSGVNPKGDGGTNDDGNDAGATACTPQGTPDDHVRNVIVSFPFDAAGDKATKFELLSLAVDGTLTDTGKSFQMGTATSQPILFTPDGRIAVVAQDDGTIGVVRIDDGNPVVVNSGFQGSFYASSLVMDPSGSHLYALDEDTSDNGGGVYEVDIACDGTLTDNGQIVPGSNAQAMGFVPSSTRAVLSGAAAFDSPDGSDTHLVDFSDGGASLVASGNGFQDGGAIVYSVAVMPDGKFALAADDGFGHGNRIAVVKVPEMTSAQVIDTSNPAAVAASPYGNAALVLNSEGTDGLHILSYNPSSASPFAIVGEVAYKNPKPQLPSYYSQINRGALKGRVLVAELSAVRQVSFEPDAGVTDVSYFNFDKDGGFETIVGVVGVEP
ncbi:MAG TPA: hypothetical protein VF407_24875 [Polyangiaceae bacterium]